MVVDRTTINMRLHDEKLDGWIEERVVGDDDRSSYVILSMFFSQF